MAEIEQGDAVRKRLTEELEAAQKAMDEQQAAGTLADRALAEAQETLSLAREERATLAARAENEEARRSETARISGERFQCPPPLLAERFTFDEADVKPASVESEEMDRLTASRSDGCCRGFCHICVKVVENNTCAMPRE